MNKINSKNLHRLTLMAIMVLPFILISNTTFAQTEEPCPLEGWAQNVVGAWNEGATINNIDCYRDAVTSMNMGRNLRDEVIAQFDTMFPRAGYKVVGLDPINAALPGVDRPMVGAMYVSMFLANGTTLPLDSAEIIITEPDFIVSVSDSQINAAKTIEEAIKHIDRIYAFIETLAPIFVNNPPNPYLMQASNLMARWGVLGESVEVVPTEEFIRSLETMTVTFQDGDGNVLAKQPGSYLGNNPLNGILVVIDELQRRGEQLQPGDLISSGSYMPPILVDKPAEYEAIYEGIGGKNISVSTSFR